LVSDHFKGGQMKKLIRIFFAIVCETIRTKVQSKIKKPPPVALGW
jgi:hypothetical protein